MTPRIAHPVAALLLAAALPLVASDTRLDGEWLPQAQAHTMAPPASDEPSGGDRGPRRGGGPGGGDAGGGPPGGGMGGPPPGNGQRGPDGPGAGRGPRNAPPSATTAPAMPGAEVLPWLAPSHAPLLLEVTGKAVALATAGSNAVLFVPFAPDELALADAQLQARRSGDRIIVDVREGAGTHLEVHYLNERADGGALLVVARSMTADGQPGKVLFERRYERATAR